MFRRLFWLAIGAGFGFGISFWLMRTVRTTVDRYKPERLGTDAAAVVRGLGADLRSAFSEGRAAMAEREAELRAETTIDLRAANPATGAAKPGA